MSKAANKDPIERMVHLKFHHIADKNNLDVDLVSEIISEWNDFEDSFKYTVVKKLRSKIYPKVIQVFLPTRFYWNENGFDGIDFGPMPETTTSYQHRLLIQILNTLQELLEKKEHKISVPEVYLKAFGEEE